MSDDKNSPTLRLVCNRADLAEYTSLSGLVNFLHEHLKPYEDSPEDIRAGLEYALKDGDGPGGFILLALQDQTLQGALVVLNTGMRGYIPAHVLLFVAVDASLRGRGIGARLICAAQKECGGDMKLHVDYDNPARRLYERLGFSSKYAEMRWTHESTDY